ncbi:hypothetical protein [Actinoalloteichus caeruleus]|uniref:hypothetical protein n=1 Tax=Actinoalloteichus cyanogriseus TaxID=2893586 RepID=UPI003AAEEE6A
MYCTGGCPLVGCVGVEQCGDLGDLVRVERVVQAGERGGDLLGVAEPDQHGGVRIHRVTVAMELGDVQVAVDLGPRVDTRALPVERRVRHAIETARAFVRWNRADDALALLLEAKTYAPEQVRYHRLSRLLVREMIRHPRPADRAIELAHRMGVRGTDPRRP